MRISDWSSDVCSSDLVELVLLGLAADDRVIFKQQARAAGPGALAEFIGGRHAREAAAHDVAVDRLVDGKRRWVGIGAIVDSMCRVGNGDRIAVGPAIVADAAIAGPRRPRRRNAMRSRQRRVTRQQGGPPAGERALDT